MAQLEHIEAFEKRLWGAANNTTAKKTEKLLGSKTNLGHPISEINDESMEPEFGSLLKRESHRDLGRRVHHECSGFPLQPSKMSPRKMATHWTTLLDELPETAVVDDIVSAIRSTEFESLHSLSWGLLLSDDMIGRFSKQLKNYHDQRSQLLDETERAFQQAHKNLSHSESAVRLSAIGNLMAYPKKHLLFPKLIRMVVGNARDDSEQIRIEATRSLYILAVNGELPANKMKLLKKSISVAVDDPSPDVSDEAAFLLEQLREYQVAECESATN